MKILIQAKLLLTDAEAGSGSRIFSLPEPRLRYHPEDTTPDFSPHWFRHTIQVKYHANFQLID